MFTPTMSCVISFIFSFFGQHGGASQWMVCYQQGLPRQVFILCASSGLWSSGSSGRPPGSVSFRGFAMGSPVGPPEPLVWVSPSLPASRTSPYLSLFLSWFYLPHFLTSWQKLVPLSNPILFFTQGASYNYYLSHFCMFKVMVIC